MEYKLYFSVPCYTTAQSHIPIPMNDDYTYWKPLITHFLSKSTTLEIHCWNEELEVINELKNTKKKSNEMIHEENITIFKFDQISSFKKYITNQYLTIDGRIKWFSLFFYHETLQVFTSEHWGTEFFVPSISEAEISYLRKIMPKGTNFVQYRK